MVPIHKNKSSNPKVDIITKLKIILIIESNKVTNNNDESKQQSPAIPTIEAMIATVYQ